MGMFHPLLPCNESTLEADPFWPKYSHFLRAHPRGFGYWIWKPWLTLRALQALPEDCYLFYTDAGCSLVKTGAHRAVEYTSLLRDGDRQIFAFMFNNPCRGACTWSPLGRSVTSSNSCTRTI